MPLRKYLKKWANPAFWGVIAISILWIFFAICLRHFWIGESDDSKLSTRVYVHIGNLLFACIVITVHSFYIFRRKDFHCWFSNVAFLFFILVQLLLMVNALTMPAWSKLKTAFCVESFLIFLFMCLYTQAVTMQHRVLLEIARTKVEEKELVIRKWEGGCYTIPLKLTNQPESKIQFKGPAASQPKGKEKALN